MDLKEYFGGAPVGQRVEALRKLYAERDSLVRYLGSENPYLHRLIVNELAPMADRASAIAAVIENMSDPNRIARKLRELAREDVGFSVEALDRDASEFLRAARFYLRQEYAVLAPQLRALETVVPQGVLCTGFLDAWDDNRPDPTVIQRATSCVAEARRFLFEGAARIAETVRQSGGELERLGFLPWISGAAPGSTAHENTVVINRMLGGIDRRTMTAAYQSLGRFCELALSVVPANMQGSMEDTGPLVLPEEAAPPNPVALEALRGTLPHKKKLTLKDFREKISRDLDLLDQVKTNNETIGAALRSLGLIRDLLWRLLVYARAFVDYVAKMITNVDVVRKGVDSPRIDRHLQRITESSGYICLSNVTIAVGTVTQEFSRAF